MSKLITVAAAQLLEIEKVKKTRALSDGEAKARGELVAQIFSAKAKGAERRKSIRIEVSAKCSITAQNNTFECELENLSLTGISFSSELFKSNTANFEFRIESIQVQGQEIQVGLSGKTLYRSFSGSQTVFGAVFNLQNPPEVQRTYLEEVYHPSYIHYLENLVAQESL